MCSWLSWLTQAVAEIQNPGIFGELQCDCTCSGKRSCPRFRGRKRSMQYGGMCMGMCIETKRGRSFWNVPAGLQVQQLRKRSPHASSCRFIALVLFKPAARSTTDFSWRARARQRSMQYCGMWIRPCRTVTSAAACFASQLNKHTITLVVHVCLPNASSHTFFAPHFFILALQENLILQQGKKY